jgi:hypothetical protein
MFGVWESVSIYEVQGAIRGKGRCESSPLTTTENSVKLCISKPKVPCTMQVYDQQAVRT